MNKDTKVVRSNNAAEERLYQYHQTLEALAKVCCGPLKRPTGALGILKVAHFSLIHEKSKNSPKIGTWYWARWATPQEKAAGRAPERKTPIDLLLSVHPSSRQFEFVMSWSKTGQGKKTNDKDVSVTQYQSA